LVRPSLRSLQIIAGRLGRGIEYFVGDQPLTSTKRVHYHRVAAEAAVERSDWSAVRQEVDSAFRHTPTRRERGKLLRLLVSAELAAHETERAFEHVAEALAVLDPTADADDVAKLHYARGFAYVELGQLVAATDSFEAARDLLERMTDAALELSVLQSMASVSVDRGKLDVARDFADRCRSRALAIGDDRMAAVAETELARAALAAGDAASALSAATHAEG